MKERYNLTVYIGRFQPAHLAHIYTIKEAFKLGENVLVLIGSANQPRTIKNPWTWEERGEMIKNSLDKELQQKIIISPLYDSIYNVQGWVKQVQDVVASKIHRMQIKKPKIAIIGYIKNESSYYLKMFPQWDFIDVGNIKRINAKDIRKEYFKLNNLPKYENLSTFVNTYLKAFKLTDSYERLTKEYDFICKYKKSWENSPYEPIFVTVDCLVVQSGHILLIRRRSEPGKRLFAMPGGFLRQNEKIEDSAIRELREETKIKVPEPVLRGSIKAKEVYDNPNRSLRGRTITHAFLIELQPGELPKIKGSSDAEKATWIEMSVFEQMEDQMFEDHFSLIKDLLGKL